MPATSEEQPLNFVTTDRSTPMKRRRSRSPPSSMTSPTPFPRMPMFMPRPPFMSPLAALAFMHPMAWPAYMTAPPANLHVAASITSSAAVKTEQRSTSEDGSCESQPPSTTTGVDDDQSLVSVESKHFLPMNHTDLAGDSNCVSEEGGSLKCSVCSDTSSGKHYGILACNGCSGFFKRSVRRKLIYRCQAGSGQCLVDKAHRNQCQACRLRKCLVMGMNKDAVQNERQPRNTATVKSSDEAQFIDTNGNASNLTITTNDDGGPAAQEDTIEAAVAVSDTSERLLAMALDWGRQQCPAMSTEELQSMWHQLFLLSVFQWSLPMNECPLISKAVNHDPNNASLQQMQAIFKALQAMDTSVAELAALKTLVLYRQETLQQTASSEEVDSALATLYREEEPTRIGRLLLLLAHLAAMSQAHVQVCFFRSTLHPIDVNKFKTVP